MDITSKYLQENPNHVFVFGDNLDRFGHGGAAALRDQPNTYGFITKKHPNNYNSSFYYAEEYELVYKQEINKLIEEIIQNPNKTYLISKLGAGLANKYRIFEQIIKPNIKKDLNLPNVKFLW